MAKIAGRAPAAIIVLICFFIAALEGYDIQAFGVSAPRIAADFGLNPGQLGYVGSAAMAGLVIGAFLGGWAADRYGRRPVLLVSVAVFGLFSVWTGYTVGYDDMLWARFATGLGFGGAMPNLIAIASEIAKPERRAATVTTMFCGMPAGGATVSLIARFGTDVDWRTIFLIGGVLPLLLVPVILFILPETKPKRAEGVDHGYIKTLFGEGRAAATLLIWLAFFLTLVVLYLLLNWLPTLVIAKNLTPADGATAAMWFNLISIIGSLMIGFVVDNAGFRLPLLAVYALMAVVMFALAKVTDLGLVLIFSGLAGFLVLGAQYSLYAIAPAIYPPHAKAAGAGAAVAVGRFGSIVGPLVAGFLRQAGMSAEGVFMALIPVIIAAGVAMLLLAVVTKTDKLAGMSATH